MIGHLGQLIHDYGYLIVALFIFAEGMAIPFPTDTTLVTAAALAAHGQLSVAIIFVISTVATTAGTTVAFVAGRRGGDFFDKHSRRVNPAVLARTRGFFDRHGGSAVFVGRFVPVARMLISPMAGLSTMSLARFTVFNVAGAAVWSAVFCAVGYFFGHHPPSLHGGVVRAAMIVAVALALLVTVAVAGGWLVEECDAAWRAEGTIWHRALMSPPARWLAGHSPRARAFLFRRFTPGDYLGLNLTIGLGLSFVALVIFSALMNALLSQNALPQFDRALAGILRDVASPRTDAAWRTVSALGRLPVVFAAGAVVALVLAVRRDWLGEAGLLAALVGSLILDATVKHFFLHAHAAANLPVAQIGTPSGQALATVVGYGMVSYFLVLLLPSRRAGTAIVISALALVVAISFARVALGIRYFSDVVSGLAAGGVWLSACITGLEVARRRSARDLREGPGRR